MSRTAMRPPPADWETTLANCPLPAWSGDRARCSWCDAELAGRRRRWCSDACSREFARQHAWTNARSAAVARDGHMCRRCGRGPGAAALLVLLTPARPAPDPTDFSDGWQLRARFARWCDTPLEVNHREPRWSQGYHNGCWNHLEPDRDGNGGLETLCRPCHRAETERWRRIRWRFIRVFGIDIADPSWTEEAAAAAA